MRNLWINPKRVSDGYFVSHLYSLTLKRVNQLENTLNVCACDCTIFKTNRPHDGSVKRLLELKKHDEI